MNLATFSPGLSSQPPPWPPCLLPPSSSASTCLSRKELAETQIWPHHSPVLKPSVGPYYLKADGLTLPSLSPLQPLCLLFSTGLFWVSLPTFLKSLLPSVLPRECCAFLFNTQLRCHRPSKAALCSGHAHCSDSHSHPPLLLDLRFLKAGDTPCPWTPHLAPRIASGTVKALQECPSSE